MVLFRGTKCRQIWIILTCLALVLIYINLSRRNANENVSDEEISIIKNRMMQILLKKPLSEESIYINDLNVYIYEEHHEVLLAWYKETDAKKTYTLIHIDSHSDLAAIDFRYFNFPIGRRPENDDQLRTLIQNNDNFITGAAATGMIDKVFFFFPKWITELSMNVQVLMGITKFNKTTEMCECLRSRKRNRTTCYIDDESEENTNGTRVKLSHCAVHYEYSLFATRLAVANKMLNKRKLFSSTTDFILDIDEDFFGVELPASDLVNAGINSSVIDFLHGDFIFILCPQGRPGDELMVDEWFRMILAEIKKCYHIGRMHKPCLLSPDNAYKMYLLSFYKKNPYFDCMTKHNITRSDVRKGFLKIWSFLIEMNDVQLDLLRRVGLCFFMSPRSFPTSNTPMYSTGLCIGGNTPGHSLVKEYAYSKRYLNFNFHLLEEVLRKLPKPRVVTIARSSRDGYVPRELQPIIEKRILQILKRIYQITDENIIYDEFLAGGRAGWNARFIN